MRRSLLTVLFVVSWVLQGHAADILFMQSPANLDFDDLLGEYMESLGHDVTYFDTTGTIDEDQIDAALASDIVFIAESLGSTSTHDGVDTFIKDVEVPQIWAEAYAWDEAALTGDIQFEDFGNTQRANIDEEPVEEFNEGQTEFFILDPSHPMAAGFTGSVTVYEDPYSLNWGLTETLGDGATIIASVDADGKYATSFVYDKGAKLEDGTEAADIRIALWLGQAGEGAPFYDNLTTDGLTLIEAAINYGLGLTTVGDPGDYNGNGSLDADDIDQLSAAVEGGLTDGKFDLNSDGSVNADDRLHWINELVNTYVGDSNLDGEFNSSDFVVVFTAGKYESGQAATYAEGDWNGDMLFNSSDFVAAFGQGGYERGPKPAAVPEPLTVRGGFTLLAIAAFALRRSRRSFRAL